VPAASPNHQQRVGIKQKKKRRVYDRTDRCGSLAVNDGDQDVGVVRYRGHLVVVIARGWCGFRLTWFPAIGRFLSRTSIPAWSALLLATVVIGPVPSRILGGARSCSRCSAYDPSQTPSPPTSEVLTPSTRTVLSQWEHGGCVRRLLSLALNSAPSCLVPFRLCVVPRAALLHIVARPGCSHNAKTHARWRSNKAHIEQQTVSHRTAFTRSLQNGLSRCPYRSCTCASYPWIRKVLNSQRLTGVIICSSPPVVKRLSSVPLSSSTRSRLSKINNGTTSSKRR
ncbi:hypothetical protein H4582DRAFT_1858537, partial [Lactarius indigo]